MQTEKEENEYEDKNEATNTEENVNFYVSVIKENSGCKEYPENDENSKKIFQEENSDDNIEIDIDSNQSKVDINMEESDTSSQVH